LQCLCLLSSRHCFPVLLVRNPVLQTKCLKYARLQYLMSALRIQRVMPAPVAASQVVSGSAFPLQLLHDNDQNSAIFVTKQNNVDLMNFAVVVVQLDFVKKLVVHNGAWLVLALLFLTNPELAQNFRSFRTNVPDIKDSQIFADQITLVLVVKSVVLVFVIDIVRMLKLLFLFLANPELAQNFRSFRTNVPEIENSQIFVAQITLVLVVKSVVLVFVVDYVRMLLVRIFHEQKVMTSLSPTTNFLQLLTIQWLLLTPILEQCRNHVLRPTVCQFGPFAWLPYL